MADTVEVTWTDLIDWSRQLAELGQRAEKAKKTDRSNMYYAAAQFMMEKAKEVAGHIRFAEA